MKVPATRAIPPRVAILVMIMFLLLAAAWQATATRPTGPAVAMSAECHQAYRGYMEAGDAAEADF